jgi:hypothetical protein
MHRHHGYPHETRRGARRTNARVVTYHTFLRRRRSHWPGPFTRSLPTQERAPLPPPATSDKAHYVNLVSAQPVVFPRDGRRLGWRLYRAGAGTQWRHLQRSLQVWTSRSPAAGGDGCFTGMGRRSLSPRIPVTSGAGIHGGAEGTPAPPLGILCVRMVTHFV